MKPIPKHPVSILLGAVVIGGAFLVSSMQSTTGYERLYYLTAEQAEILGHMSIVYLDDGYGNEVNKTIRITGVNVQVVNGLDATNGYPPNPDSINPALTVVNGVGNLVVGYNELGNFFGDDRTGSHNVVVGHGNSYSSFGGFVGPHDNTTSGPFASVTGGSRNRASGEFSTVSGGAGNTASGYSGSVSGGYGNTAGGGYYSWCCSVSGGQYNTAGGSNYPDFDIGCSVSGGRANTANGESCSVSGGLENTASGVLSSVSGGQNNTASGGEVFNCGPWGDFCAYAGGSVSGGLRNTAGECWSSVSGGSYNTASGYSGSVSGGGFNTASGGGSSVSGGNNRSVSGNYDWAAGTYWSDY